VWRVGLGMIALVACDPVPRTAAPPSPPPTATRKPGPPDHPPVTVHKARSRFSLEVLGIELVGTLDPVSTEVAHSLTIGLRALARADGQIELGRKNVDLIDARLMAGCVNDELPCMHKIARSLHVDRIVFGIVNALGDGDYYVHVSMLDEATGRLVKWTGTSQSSSADLVYTAEVAFDSLLQQ